MPDQEAKPPQLLEIVGQDHALTQLQRLLAGQRRPHAYIFTGPEGVGRGTTALAFGQLLLCERPVERANRGRLADLPEDFPLRQACGACGSCLAAQAGTNPDLVSVYKELALYHEDPAVRDRVMQELSIEVVRQFLIAAAYRAAVGGRGKVFVVREAELMSTPAQNALLKTLEEPPPGVSIILLAPAPEELLPTTRSRCQPVRFIPLPHEFVTARLVAAGIEPAQAKFWAGLTEGSLGRSLRLANEELYQFKRELVERLANQGAAPDAELAQTLTKAMERHAKRAVAHSENLSASLANRRAGQMLLELLSSVYRDALAVASGQRRELIHADQAQAIGRIAARWGAEPIAEILTHLSQYEQQLWRNVNARLLWDNIAITCATAAAP